MFQIEVVLQMVGLTQEPIASSHSRLPEEPTRAAHWGKLNKYLRVRQMLNSTRHYGAQLRPTKMENMLEERSNGVTAVQIVNKTLKG